MTWQKMLWIVGAGFVLAVLPIALFEITYYAPIEKSGWSFEGRWLVQQHDKYIPMAKMAADIKRNGLAVMTLRDRGIAARHYGDGRYTELAVMPYWPGPGVDDWRITYSHKDVEWQQFDKNIVMLRFKSWDWQRRFLITERGHHPDHCVLVEQEAPYSKWVLSRLD